MEFDKSRLTEIANAYHTYNQLLLDNNCLDFGDLIYYTVKLLENGQTFSNLCKKDINLSFADEFQDVMVAVLFGAALTNGGSTSG